MTTKNDEQFVKILLRCYRMLAGIVIFVFVFPFVALFFSTISTSKDEEILITADRKNEDAIVDGMHVSSGLVANEGYKTVLANCTKCHSARLVIQNRATREGWESMIQWMQKTQNLWALGENEKVILDYLSKNYSPKNKGRRSALTDIEWYQLDK